MPAHADRYRALLGQAFRAVRDIKEGAASVRRRRRARQGAGQARAGAHAVGEQLATPVGAPAGARRCRAPRALARLGARREHAQEGPRRQSGGAVWLLGWRSSAWAWPPPRTPRAFRISPLASRSRTPTVLPKSGDASSPSAFPSGSARG